MATTSDELAAAIFALYCATREREWPDDLYVAKRTLRTAARRLFPHAYRKVNGQIRPKPKTREQMRLGRARYLARHRAEVRAYEHRYRQRNAAHLNALERERRRVAREQHPPTDAQRQAWREASARYSAKPAKRAAHAASERRRRASKRVVRIDDLTPRQRDVVLALIAADKAGKAKP